MYPILVRIGPISIPTYGLMMAIGVGLGLCFLYLQSKKQGLDAPRIFDAGFYTILISLAGAKLVLLLGNISYYLRYPGELLSLARSGGVFQGGLAFGVVFSLWYFRRRHIPTWKTADIIGPALALGHGFGRVGCFMAGCCYGRVCESPLGVRFHSQFAHDLTGIPLGIGLYPVQLFESVLNFLNFFLLYLILRRKSFDGQVFSLYIVFYSVIRIGTEFFRGDHPEKAFLIRGSSPFLSLTFPQLFGLVGIFAGVFLYFVLEKKKSV
jgi:phosphatidylglycerol---prolipoprotein diacylglyceryl transferase